MMERRPYGVYALYVAGRWWPVLVVPLVRLLTTIRDMELHTIIRDALWCALPLLYGIFTWYSCRYRVSRLKRGWCYSMAVRQGIVVRRSLYVDAQHAVSVEVERTPFLAVCGGRRVRINTEGLRRRSDMVLYLPVAQVEALFCLRDRPKVTSTRLFHVFVTAVSGSNAAVGLLTAIPILRQIGKLLGDAPIPDAVGVLQRVMATQVPAMIRLAGNLLLLGWGVAVLRNFLRYVGFYAAIQGDCLHLVSGLFTRRDVLIDRDKITAVEIRQTVFMRLLGLHTAVLTAAGYGRDWGSRPVLVPAADPKTLRKELKRLLPQYPMRTTYRSAQRRGWWRYVLAPLAVMIGSIPFWHGGGFWQVPAVACLVFGGWWFWVRLLGWRGAGFGADCRAVTVRYPRGLALYQVHLPCEAVDEVAVTQGFWQRRAGTCTVTVRCFGEKKRRHRVWGMSYDETLAEIKQMVDH